MAKPHKCDQSTERAIAGALRAAIHAHGPITPDKIGSAVKRVVGNLRNARAPTAADMGRKRWAGLSAEERQAITGKGGSAAWAGMTKAERSAEMKRRAAKRKARRNRAT